MSASESKPDRLFKFSMTASIILTSCLCIFVSVPGAFFAQAVLISICIVFIRASNAPQYEDYIEMLWPFYFLFLVCVRPFYIKEAIQDSVFQF